MPSIDDVFARWDTISDLAADIGEKPDTVYRWKKRRRIPEAAWASVIAAASRRGIAITADELLAVNTPMKQRGRPAHRTGSQKRRAA